MNKLKLIIRYGKVGKFLHFVAFWALIVATYSFLTLNNLEYNADPFIWFTWLALFISFFNMSILAELDAYSRFQNYKQIKDQIYFNKYQERLLKPLAKSSCQRSSAILAGNELGFGEEVRTYFYNRGYRWYHIIPDFVFQDPLFFFTFFFWRTTFFAPYYKPKVNYEQLVYLESKRLF